MRRRRSIPRIATPGRVSFKLFASGPAPTQAQAARPRREARAHHDAIALAKRLEALRRAFNAPEACIRRLARLLRKQPALAQILARPVGYIHRGRGRGCAEAINAAARVIRADLDSS